MSLTRLTHRHPVGFVISYSTRWPNNLTGTLFDSLGGATVAFAWETTA